ncbi:rhamnogalacturonan acetylesterase [Salibacterium salarium]|uniref:Rhamnogalacturonan acetylesterase n=1 Tax=Salibacterium salarium TaxID=284579 RepID=A0A3R9P8I3_9BACI|nr:rhamnogalacturonan acetylesterase [Salibacterium salarium]RSL35230.1 rhamnogalacturonan acetylesterase [Salibacterium salarium]
MKSSITIYLAGDSTVQTYGTSEEPQAGWGQYLDRYVDEAVSISNHAIGGRSSKTFITEGRLEAISSEMNETDYLLIQMGHNDSTKNKPERYTDPYTDYKQYVRQYIEQARRRKATPILITPVGRLHYVRKEFLADFGDYCNAMKEVAEEEKVELIDLMAKSIAYYSSIGYEKTAELFMISMNGTDCTHFTEKGAYMIAQLVAKEMKQLDDGISTYVTV